MSGNDWFYVNAAPAGFVSQRNWLGKVGEWERDTVEEYWTWGGRVYRERRGVVTPVHPAIEAARLRHEAGSATPMGTWLSPSPRDRLRASLHDMAAKLERVAAGEAVTA